MTDRDGRRPPFRPLLVGLTQVSAPAYGYTLSVWGGGASLTHQQGMPAVGEAFLFVAGAVAAFAAIAALATFGFRRIDPEQREAGLVLGGALHLLAAGAAVGAAALVGTLVDGSVAWPLGAFVLTAAYVLLTTVQEWAGSAWLS